MSDLNDTDSFDVEDVTPAERFKALEVAVGLGFLKPKQK